MVKLPFPRPHGGDPVKAGLYILRNLLFPAHAGVILIRMTTPKYPVTFPRLCGGDPVLELRTADLKRFSPPTRG